MRVALKIRALGLFWGWEVMVFSFLAVCLGRIRGADRSPKTGGAPSRRAAGAFHRQSRRFVGLLLAGLFGIALTAACESEAEPTATPTAPVIVRRLATLGPTRTPDATEQQATQLAFYATPTYAPPTVTPTPTPYVGIFIGEAELEQSFGVAINPLDVIVLPTRQFPLGIPMICTIDADTRVFGMGWMTETYAVSGLRCPIQQSYGFDGTAQVFEHGVMYLNPNTGEVWAISPETPVRNGRHWYVDQPPSMSTQGVEAPEGLRVPRGSFGAVWVSDPAIREALGYAVTREQNSSVNLQRFEGGTLFLDATAGQVFVLLVNGEALGGYNVD